MRDDQAGTANANGHLVANVENGRDGRVLIRSRFRALVQDFSPLW